MSAARRRWCAAIFLAASPALAQQPLAPAADPATGSIEGTVFDASTAGPLRKAEVRLGGGSAPTDLRAGTDPNGHFAFRGLPAGAYWVSAQHPGYGGSVQPTQIALQPGEQKSGIEIRLSPLGTISGRVFDEFGAPVPNCSVNALQPQTTGGRRGLMGRGGTATNDRGEYSIQGLDKGRYYVSLRCHGELEAPHPLMTARDPRRPYTVYAPQVYPGVPDTNGATRLKVTPGVETQGIDFQVSRTPAVTVRGRVDVPDPSVLSSGNVNIQLLPPSLDPAEGTMFGAGIDPHTGEFQFHAVNPGSYILVASTNGNGPIYLAQVPLQIGVTPPDAVRIALAPAPEMSGTVEVEGDNPPPLESLWVALEPLGPAIVTQQRRAQVSKDGAFTLPGVTPGKWRLSVQGVTYVKALSVGERDVSPYGFDLAPGAAGPIRILASNKTGQVQVTVSAASARSGQVSLLLVPADLERLDSGLARVGAMGASGGQTIMAGIVPGRYRLFALDTTRGWELLQRPEALKALETRAQAVEVAEGETVQGAADLIAADELEEALDKTQ
jgi:hypothetical protein